jgi:hypothetical protein
VHVGRNTAVARRGKAGIDGESASREVVGMLMKGEVQIRAADAKFVAMSVARNWILLGLFEFGQAKGGTLMAGMGIESNKDN